MFIFLPSGTFLGFKMTCPIKMVSSLDTFFPVWISPFYIPRIYDPRSSCKITFQSPGSQEFIRT